MPYDLKLKYSLDDFALFLDGAVRDVCQTKAFSRLADISFLGAVEKGKSYAGRRHSRFDHSIGVALLAQHYAETMKFPEKTRRSLVLAALLHDVGHAPLSHSLEPLFVKEFGLNHHIATENLLKGKVPLGQELWAILNRHNVDPDELIDLMSGKDASEKGRIFSAPINVDTIEAIWRGGSYFSKQLTNPIAVLDAFINLNCKTGSPLDSFWEEKNNFYQLMIYSREGVAADHWARMRVELSERTLTPEDFYLTEKSFFSKRKKETPKLVESCLHVKLRTFEINKEEKVSSYSSLINRYLVKKTIREMVVNPPEERFVGDLQPSMF